MAKDQRSGSPFGPCLSGGFVDTRPDSPQERSDITPWIYGSVPGKGDGVAVVPKVWPEGDPSHPTMMKTDIPAGVRSRSSHSQIPASW